MPNTELQRTPDDGGFRGGPLSRHPLGQLGAPPLHLIFVALHWPRLSDRSLIGLEQGRALFCRIPVAKSDIPDQG